MSAARATAICALLASLSLVMMGSAAALAGSGATPSSAEAVDDGLLNSSNASTAAAEGSVVVFAGSVESNEDTAGGADDSDDETSAGDRLANGEAARGDQTPTLVGISASAMPGVHPGEVGRVLRPDPSVVGADSGSSDRVSDGGGGQPLAIGSTGDPSGTPLPEVPADGVTGGGLVGAVAIGVVIRQGFLSGSSAGPAFGAAIAPVAAASDDVLERLVRMVAPLRYSRFDDSDPLEHEARGQLFEVVKDSPGAYLSEVSEQAGVPISTARHHARVLEQEGLIASSMIRGRRRFYPGQGDGLELAAALNDDPTAGLLDALVRMGSASVSALAEELDRDPSTVSHHLSRLEEDGIVVREREGRAIKNRLSPEAAAALDPDRDQEARVEALASAD